MAIVGIIAIVGVEVTCKYPFRWRVCQISIEWWKERSFVLQMFHTFASSGIACIDLQLKSIGRWILFLCIVWVKLKQYERYGGGIGGGDSRGGSGRGGHGSGSAAVLAKKSSSNNMKAMVRAPVVVMVVVVVVVAVMVVGVLMFLPRIQAQTI